MILLGVRRFFVYKFDTTFLSGQLAAEYFQTHIYQKRVAVCVYI